MLKSAILILGILLLINTVSLTFVSNFNLGIVLGVIVSAALVLYSFLFDRLTRVTHVIIGLICAFPIALIIFLAVYGGIDNAKGDEDVIIVLGAGVRGKKVSLTLARRLDEAARFYQSTPDSHIIVCGGMGPGEEITEALAMEQYLIAKGVPGDKITKEEKSTSTYENFTFAIDILNAKFPGGFTSVFITNDFHVYRSNLLARKAGITPAHIGAYTEWYTWPSNYMRETLAVLAAWVLPSAK